MSHAPTRTAELRSVQYLRAVAALMVVAHHARHYFPEGEGWTGVGSRGVDIFFVISGFVMAHSVARSNVLGPPHTRAAEFLRRRFVRVVPLYWLALLWTTKREWAAGHFGVDLGEDLVFWPHFHAVYRDGIYPALIPGWTINYEMFFYVLFAVALLFGRARRWLLPTVLVGLVVVGTTPLVGTGSSAPVLFYTHTVILEFALGLAVHALWHRWPRLLPMPAAAVLSAVALGLLAVETSDRWRGVLDGLPAALLVWSCLRWGERLDSRLLQSLGDASYSIYLFHLASFAVSAWILNAFAVHQPTAWNVASAITLHLVVASIAGFLVYLAVERPLLRFLRQRTRGKRRSQ